MNLNISCILKNTYANQETTTSIINLTCHILKISKKKSSEQTTLAINIVVMELQFSCESILFEIFNTPNQVKQSKGQTYRSNGKFIRYGEYITLPNKQFSGEY